MVTYNDTEKETYDKAGAETVFGMDYDYTKEDLDNAYHSAVEEAVAAGDTDKLEDLTAARDVLTEGFNAGAAVMSSDIKPEYTVSGAMNTDWGDIWEGFNTFDEAVGRVEDKMEPISLSECYTTAHHAACEKVGIPTDTDYPAPKRKNMPPLWYRGIYKLVQAPIWRIAFIVLVVLWGVTDIQSNPDANIMDDAFNILFSWVGLLVIMLLNTIFGWATNFVRWVLMVVANWGVRLQLNHQELSAAKAYVAKNANVTTLAKPGAKQ